jgi:DNA-binding transcriptional LysR family regulator
MVRKFDYLVDAEAFLAVVEHGSFTAAATVLSTTASVLSRAVSRLEARLGQQLLRRTTRQISLTDIGRSYHAQARQAFVLLDEAACEVRSEGGESSGALTGRIRLSVPTTYGHYRLPALLRPFIERHPQVQLEVNITNRNVDLVSEGVDMAIRLGNLPMSGLVARKLEEADLRLVAAPAYLRRAGRPALLQDLAQHVCLPFVLPRTGRYGAWSFRVNGADVEWTPRATIEVSDDVLGTVSLAAHGLGICQTYGFVVRERLLSGELVELLPELAGRTRPFSLIYSPHRHQSAAARALIAVMVSAGVA